jgi:hypothetical protein
MHSLDDWAAFDDRQIAAMDGAHALRFWRQHKTTLLALGHKAQRAQLAEAQRDSERLDLMIEQRAYVVSDPDCCDGYWLNYLRPDGTVWTQATEHETPRAAIDAAMGERNA